MTSKEFSIKSLPELQFRTARISPIDLLAITTQMDIKKYEPTKALYTFALENIEVLQGEKWQPVKVSGKEIYTPTSLEDNLTALNELIAYFLEEVVMKTFTESSE